MLGEPLGAESGPAGGELERPPLSGFEGMERRWDRRAGQFVVRLRPGEFYITEEDERIVTVLGSCVAACIRDPERGIGGMNHFLLPDRRDGDRSAWRQSVVSEATRYGSVAMERLINGIVRCGGRRGRLEVKIFGGSALLSGRSEVGLDNVRFVRRYLETEGLPIAALDVAGCTPRRVVYFPATGTVRVRRLGELQKARVLEREERYRRRVERMQIGGDVELF